jgi:hypothetical protein
MLNVRWLGSLDDDELLCFEPRKHGVGPLDLVDLVDQKLLCYVEQEPGQVGKLKGGGLHIRTVKRIEEAAFQELHPVRTLLPAG